MSPSEPTPSASDSFDQSRFLPGTMLAGRYRIHGLLGRGGMGEVYRADDMKLGQPVALKFLPKELERMPGRLERFLNEVKLARQIAHLNVCRVYDIGEVDGQHFLSMEYVDGEDLASLLRRIGRLPQDKAIEIARQLCAGLAAAHEQGILHRDLKPANLMIDGQGRVRITDFGLAGLAGDIRVEDSRAGTPGYMAPEQLEGKQVTARSDVYALGALLYELFTGRRAFAAKTVGELRRLQLESSPTNPSTLVEGIDPAVERVILRCIEKDVDLRPASALAVAAALPGGDPLAAALMAGETPSPEMVAAAGPRGGLRPGIAIGCVVTTLVALIASQVIGLSSSFFSRVPMTKSFQALRENAAKIVSDLGYADRPGSTAASFEFDFNDFFGIVRRDGTDSARLEAPGQTSLGFFYRQSTDRLVPIGLDGVVTASDPVNQPGDVTLRLDMQGQLAYLRVTPQRVERSEQVAPATDWAALLAAAGLDLAAFEESRPTFQPPVFADERRAWTGVLPDLADSAVRLEAASLRGRPVFFRKVTPTHPDWSEEAQARQALPNALQIALPAFFMTLFVSLLGGAVFLALRNLKHGRGDRKGAVRIAVLVFGARMLHWMLTGHHVAGFEEVAIAVFVTCGALALGLLAWVLYMAVEPYVRRLWPRALVSWNRLMAGRLRDPLVGRDLLVGLAMGALFWLVFVAVWSAAHRFGLAPLLPDNEPISAMRGGRFAVGKLFQVILANTSIALGLTALLLLLRIVSRRTWIAIGLFCLIFVAQTSLQFFAIGSGRLGSVLFGGLLGLVQSAFFVLLLTRFGVLTLTAGLLCQGIGTAYGVTIDPSSPFFGTVLFGWFVLIALIGYAFWVSLAGQRVFHDAILEGDVAPARTR